MKNAFVTDGVGCISSNLFRQQLLMGDGTVPYSPRNDITTALSPCRKSPQPSKIYLQSLHRPNNW